MLWTLTSLQVKACMDQSRICEFLCCHAWYGCHDWLCVYRCFMPLLPVSLVSTALPVVLSLLATVALVSYTCTSWSRWEDAKSMYQDSFNRREIPLLLILFGFIFLSSLACYLHVYIGLVYTFGAFIILNTLEVRTWLPVLVGNGVFTCRGYMHCWCTSL